MEYDRDNLLEQFNLLTVHIRRRHPDVLFLINVCSGAKCCPSVLEVVDISVSTRNIRNFTMFIASPATALQLQVLYKTMQTLQILHIFLY
jgi:hypothetical protein